MADILLWLAMLALAGSIGLLFYSGVGAVLCFITFLLLAVLWNGTLSGRKAAREAQMRSQQKKLEQEARAKEIASSNAQKAREFKPQVVIYPKIGEFITLKGGLLFESVNSLEDAKTALSDIKVKKRELSIEKKEIALQQQSIKSEYTNNNRRRGSSAGLKGGFKDFDRMIRNEAKVRLANKLEPLEKKNFQ